MFGFIVVLLAVKCLLADAFPDHVEVLCQYKYIMKTNESLTMRKCGV